ncbi:hypothetical protein AMAG_07873 [Allomyces macrogynus ATCC 38327]|uniref:Uncharacterized protein n=1 Tax=Allomyces macrogynus (strain ATCC 38327) TaxID=578462 RepID=A0A0L0SJU5_ALLM3|nr:hypothetical protein, variant [Allomyces macrogynus ATCC 38327]KNE62681.1 hypothetical protein AMAG_07873 [Allomyces macrogynus ATCC 38327]|eukprot:KNE62680.1 hypothetical protein, variant [Allomyces macrogynus ATCC 38327]
MARTSSLFLAAALLLALVFNVHAWGVEGHGAVAAIAQAYLTPKAKAAVDQIIGQSGTFKAYLDVASWPDNIRNQRKETSDWHYIDAEDDPAPPARKCGSRAVPAGLRRRRVVHYHGGRGRCQGTCSGPGARQGRARRDQQPGRGTRVLDALCRRYRAAAAYDRVQGWRQQSARQL